MADDPNQNLGKPIDSTQSSEQTMGDTTGMTGTTVSNNQQSASSTINNDAALGDNEKQNAQTGLSSAQMDRINDLASEPDDKETDAEPPKSAAPQVPGDLLGSEETNTTGAPYQQPYNQGEQSVSGTTPDPEADDDTLANAQAVGTQLDEDEEHPKELDLGGDIDKAQIHHETH